jgi:hypothetical protein
MWHILRLYGAGHYSGGKDQEDCSLKPAQANSESLSQKNLYKKGLMKWLKV